MGCKTGNCNDNMGCMTYQEVVNLINKLIQDGVDGQNGSPGTNGATWLSGTIVPANTSGSDGDLYLNVTNGNVYKKVAGVWVLQGSIAGPQGPQGVQGPAGTSGTNGTNGTNGEDGTTINWRNGEGVPSNALGIDGDYFIDTTTGNLYYKVAGIWTLSMSLLGPVGPQGPQGIPGVDGIGFWGQTTLVDPINGNDATGVNMDPTMPFQTVKAAEMSSTPGTKITVLPGTYNEDSLGAPDVHVHFINAKIVLGNVTANRCIIGNKSSAGLLSGYKWSGNVTVEMPATATVNNSVMGLNYSGTFTGIDITIREIINKSTASISYFHTGTARIGTEYAEVNVNVGKITSSGNYAQIWDFANNGAYSYTINIQDVANFQGRAFVGSPTVAAVPSTVNVFIQAMEVLSTEGNALLIYNPNNMVFNLKCSGLRFTETGVGTSGLVQVFNGGKVIMDIDGAHINTLGAIFIVGDEVNTTSCVLKPRGRYNIVNSGTGPIFEIYQGGKVSWETGELRSLREAATAHIIQYLGGAIPTEPIFTFISGILMANIPADTAGAKIAHSATHAVNVQLLNNLVSNLTLGTNITNTLTLSSTSFIKDSLVYIY